MKRIDSIDNIELFLHRIRVYMMPCVIIGFMWFLFVITYHSIEHSEYKIGIRSTAREEISIDNEQIAFMKV